MNMILQKVKHDGSATIKFKATMMFKKNDRRTKTPKSEVVNPSNK